MKSLTPKEFEEAPNLIRFLHCKAYCNSPVGYKMLMEAKDKHPEYFIKTDSEKLKEITAELNEQFAKSPDERTLMQIAMASKLIITKE